MTSSYLKILFVFAVAAGYSQAAWPQAFVCAPGSDATHAELISEIGADNYAKFLQELKSLGLSHGLLDDEQVAIRWYTTDDGSSLINGSLLQSDDGLNKPVAAVCLIESGMKKLPDYVGPVHRGATLSPEERERIQRSRAMVSPAFTSTSWGMGFERSDEFDIQSSSGKEITDFSEWLGEREVLFYPGTRFQLLKAGPGIDGKTWHWVLVEQSPARRRDISLERALKIMGEDYRKALIDAIVSSNHPLDPATPLPEPEMVALYLFTDHLKPKLNAILRQGGAQASVVRPIVSAINSALLKLAFQPIPDQQPESDWFTYELLTPKALARYVPGRKIVERGILQEVRQSYLDRIPAPPTGEIGCRFEIFSRHGSAVGSAYSSTADGSVETMLPSGVRFEVVRRVLTTPDHCEITLRERP